MGKTLIRAGAKRFFGKEKVLAYSNGPIKNPSPFARRRP